MPSATSACNLACKDACAELGQSGGPSRSSPAAAAAAAAVAAAASSLRPLPCFSAVNKCPCLGKCGQGRPRASLGPSERAVAADSAVASSRMAGRLLIEAIVMSVNFLVIIRASQGAQARARVLCRSTQCSRAGGRPISLAPAVPSSQTHHPASPPPESATQQEQPAASLLAAHRSSSQSSHA